MTGKELVMWIEENHAEDATVIIVTPDHRYHRVTGLWEGETDGHAMMVDAREDVPGIAGS